MEDDEAVLQLVFVLEMKLEGFLTIKIFQFHHKRDEINLPLTK